MIALLVACYLAGGVAQLGASLQEELDRLEGQEVARTDSGYEILDVAGEGKPLVGCVRLRASDLIFESGQASYRLTGPLAVPRIAGPDYKVWVIGTIQGTALAARRLGILASAHSGACATVDLGTGDEASAP